MDKKWTIVLISAALVSLAIACVTASSSINTPLYTVRMEQQSSKLNFLPTEVSKFIYTAEKGYNVDYNVAACCYVVPLATSPASTCNPSCFDTCEETCPWTCFETCSSTCSTCESTCPATCPATCYNTCPVTCSTCNPTCTEPTCPVTCAWTCSFSTCHDSTCAYSTCWYSTCRNSTCAAGGTCNITC